MIIQIKPKTLYFEVVDLNKCVSFDKIYLRNMYKSLFHMCGYECENSLAERDVDNELYLLNTVQLRCRIIDFILSNCDYPFSRLAVESVLFDTEKGDVVITPSTVLACLI